ncbi:MAG: aldehyde dehydrogenase family protein [Pseudomonadota bacterium]
MLEVQSPYDGSVLATLDTQDASDLENMLATAVHLHGSRDKWLSLTRRVEILNATAELMEQDIDGLATLIAQEGAKPLKDARVEALRAADGVRLCVEHVKSDIGRTIALGTSPLTAGHSARTHKEPIGVVAAVSAFNHPLNLIVHQVAPAVASGCPVIVKPAGDTPLSCLKFVELLHQAGLPEAWCQTLITDEVAVSEALVTDARISFFSFIGSARVGWMLRSKLAPGVRCALEHGGAAPVVVAADADIDTMIPALLKGGFYHAGQVCVSVQRVYVPETIKQKVVDALVAGVAELNVGDPLDPATDVGPLIRPAEVDRVESWVNNARSAGATIACGGERVSDRVYAPTVIVDPPADSEVAMQEIFGPVVCVFGYTEESDAITAANNVPFAFQAAVFTSNIDTAHRIAGGLNGSTIMINEHTAFRDDIMPFAGLKQSGLGIGGIPYTIEDMQIDKMIVWKTPTP